MVFSSLVSGKIRYSSRLLTATAGSADDQRGPGEAVGADGGVLVTTCPALTKSRRVRGIWSTGPAEVVSRGPSPGTISTGVEGAGQSGPGCLTGLGNQGVSRQLQARSRERASSPPTIPAHGVAGPVHLLGGGAHLTSSTRLVI